MSGNDIKPVLTAAFLLNSCAGKLQIKQKSLASSSALYYKT